MPAHAIAAAPTAGINPAARQANAPDTLVICAAEFREALRPWVEFRTAEGHKIVVIPNAASTEELRRQIGEIAKGGRLRFVVLVGDAPPIGGESGGDAAAESRCVPVHYAKARVNIDWGSEPESPPTLRMAIWEKSATRNRGPNWPSAV